MENNPSSNRRSILKSIGAGIGATSLAGLGTASSGSSSTGQPLGVQTESLSTDVTNAYFGQAQQMSTVQEMKAFLKQQGLKIDRSRLSGTRVTADVVSEHVSLKVPFKSSQDTEDGHLDLRVFNETVVSAQALIEETVYVADQYTLESAKSNVMSMLEHEQMKQAMPSAQFERNCSASYTFNGDGYGCKIIQGLAAIGAGVLTVIPEPGSTALGVVALGTILGGGCALFEGVNKFFSDCDVGELKLCVVQPCTFCTPSLYIYPSDCA